MWERAPLALFALAALMAAFGYGGFVGRYQAFPFQLISDAAKTVRATLEPDVGGSEAVEGVLDAGGMSGLEGAGLGDAGAGRFEFMGGEGRLGGPILWMGGRWRFLDICPGWGCIAVEYSAAGEVVHGYPYLPDELARAAESFSGASEHPYEFSPDFLFRRHIRVLGGARYENGDLLVTFQYAGDKAFPYGAGVARIGRDGRPVWFRRDYSHHWASMDSGGAALVPGLRVGDGDIRIARGQESGTLDCGTDKPHEDTISVIGGDGRLIRRINVLESFLESPYALALRGNMQPTDGYRPDFCDPLHLNYVHRLGADAGGAWGMAPGDLVASLRSVSGFAIMDSETGAVKRLVRGTFFDQHAVHHLGGSTFIMFDNQGGDGVHGPSRLLAIDVSDGSETTIFPNERTPEGLRGLYSSWWGGIDISPDGKRALVTFARAGAAAEVRLSDGEVLGAFRNLHPVPAGGEGDGGALSRRLNLFGMGYVR